MSMLDKLEYLAEHFPTLVARELLKTPKGSVVAVHCRVLNGKLAFGYSPRLIDYLETEKTDEFMKHELELDKILGNNSATLDDEKADAIEYREKIWMRHDNEILGYIRYPYGFVETHIGTDPKELEKKLAERVRENIKDFVTPM